jgi:hypothetical protein
MSKRIHKGHSGTRKYGRNKIKCQRYKNERRREKNKLRRLRHVFLHHPNDKVMAKAIRHLEEILRVA